jgi:hypothetical protein
MTEDGSRYDLSRIFDHVPAMQEAGATEFAIGVTGRLQGQFGSMEAIERFINELAEFAARF